MTKMNRSALQLLSADRQNYQLQLPSIDTAHAFI